MSRNVDGRIIVTAQMRKSLRDWQDKTGYGFKSLFRYAEIHKLFTPTKSLTPAAFQSILMGHTKTVLKADYGAIIAAYESHAPELWHKGHVLSRRKVRMPVNEAFRAQLKETLKTSTLSRARLLKLHGAPDDLTVQTLSSLVSGRASTIAKTHHEILERIIAGRKS